jgi:hypothetical protein
VDGAVLEPLLEGFVHPDLTPPVGSSVPSLSDDHGAPFSTYGLREAGVLPLEAAPRPEHHPPVRPYYEHREEDQGQRKLHIWQPSPTLSKKVPSSAIAPIRAHAAATLAVTLANTSVTFSWGSQVGDSMLARRAL